ncbi:MAG TPA: aminotransferase class V-fold PLP-dependent enzyme [Bryobacteraceae bacterium]|nr:aminotransferase class V-fold PLP-dependent enzyme [Bryobacteraceae bacterium]
MMNTFWRQLGLSRRDIFRAGGLMAAGGMIASEAATPPQTVVGQLHVGPDIYHSIGVRPLINARGTVTVVSGSQTLPEVKAAMDWASRRYVQIDELMEAVGKRLGELTGAEWGMVTTGAAGAIQVATCACVVGADPDKMELLSYRVAAPGIKYDVIIPRSSRNAYDHSIRAVGVRIVEPKDINELEAALSPQTAMIYLLAESRDYNAGPMSIENVAAAAHKRGVPVFVDAAAESLITPNVHLKRGADLVAYSGGKCIRGPQCAGLLLGRKDLVQAAWVNSAPHHTVCRALKAGKEEIVGMLAAVEMWMKRDHAAEEKTWTSWLDEIAARLKPIDGITTKIQPAHGIDNRTPTLGVQWDPNLIDLTEDELEQILWDGEPRIAIGGKGSFLPFPPNESHAATITPYMLEPGEQKIVADHLYRAFSTAPKPGSRKKADSPAADLSGEWDVHVAFVSGNADHSFSIRQTGNDIAGTHVGQAAIRELKGTMDGNKVLIRSSYLLHGARLDYTFEGTGDKDQMQGNLSVGEYGFGRWSAKRRKAKFPRGGRAIPG